MKKAPGAWSCLAVALILGTTWLSAHHVPAAKFDPAKSATLRGTVSKVDWLNPHVHIFIEVQEGEAVNSWAVELESTIDLRRNGWTASTVKPGDMISVTGFVARNGTRQISGNTVVAATGDRIFTVVPAQPPKSVPGPAPRWADGQVTLGPPPGRIGGYWDFPSASTLVEQGVTVRADEHGVLHNVADAAKVAPFQPWARDLYVYRQRNFLKDDPMFTQCKTQAGPRIFQARYGVVLLEERSLQRIRVLMGGGNQNWRLIYLDGRTQDRGGPEEADNPLYWGRARGKWEGDTLVVDTRGFNDAFWFSNGGLPHTQELHLIERFTRTDLNTLRYEVTIDDPGAYTRTWTSAWNLTWVPDQELPVYYCQDNRP
jgi:hypothetical protein